MMNSIPAKNKPREFKATSTRSLFHDHNKKEIRYVILNGSIIENNVIVVN